MHTSNENSKVKLAALVIAPLISVSLILFGDLEPGNPSVTYTLAIAILMAIWWITEAIPLAATALLPVALFPLLGVVDGKTISAMYFNDLIFLFLGGFLMALAMERWDLHRRIAIKVLMFFGVSPGRLLLGFMLSTSFLSMWMSNTAITMLMLPIALSIIYKLEAIVGEAELRPWSIGLLLGIAYSASIGGIATLVGTPPNLSFARITNIIFPAMPEVSFANWLIFAIWITVLLFISAWLLLYFMYRPKTAWQGVNRAEFRKEYQLLGPAKPEEKIVLILFIIMALLWVFRSGFSFGNVNIPGWSQLFGKPEYINDGTVAIAIASLLFMIPSKTSKGARLMDWQTVNRLPWHIVLLFGGGFALAQGFVDSGLSLWFGKELSGLAGTDPMLLTAAIVAMMSFLTELTSNIASTEMILPILAGMAVSIKVDPLLLMMPATLAASLAFMLPVATPPNAIIFATGKLRIIDMVKTGFLLNLAGIIVVTLVTYFWGTLVFGIDVNSFPDWALTITGNK